MPRLFVTTRAGAEVVLTGESGLSVMELIRNAGIAEGLGECGGCCSCGTCQIYVDPAREQQLPPMLDAEREILDDSPHRLPNSRLACQIPFDESLAELRVAVAPES